MKEKYGFVYIWRDQKYNRFYIGSHWGTIEDGYVCSSPWMRQAYKHRSQDFKRRILTNNIQERKLLYDTEAKWLSLIKKEEIGKKYYNLHTKHANHWTTNKDTRSIRQKISDSCKASYANGRVHNTDAWIKSISEANKDNKYSLGRKQTEEWKQAASERMQGNRHGSYKHSKEQIKKQSEVMIGKQNALGYKHTDEAIEKIRQASLGNKHNVGKPSKRKILITDGTIIYPSMTEASKILGLSLTTIWGRVQKGIYWKVAA